MRNYILNLWPGQKRLIVLKILFKFPRFLHEIHVSNSICPKPVFQELCILNWLEWVSKWTDVLFNMYMIRTWQETGQVEKYSWILGHMNNVKLLGGYITDKVCKVCLQWREKDGCWSWSEILLAPFLIFNW